MKLATFNEAIKIWDKAALGEPAKVALFDLEVQKKLLNIFSVGDYYYYIFNVKESKLDLLCEEISSVLGYKHNEVDLAFLISLFHPEDQPWFLNIENKIVEFFSALTEEQIPNYKVRYDYRIRKNDGKYIRILQQTIALQHSEVGGILKSFGVHTDISDLKMEGKPVLSFIGLNGEPFLLMLVNGRKTKEIAVALNISQETVSTHRRNILTKTKSRNTSELVVMAIKKG